MKIVVSKLVFRRVVKSVMNDLNLKSIVFQQKNIVFAGYILLRYCLHRRIPHRPWSLVYNVHFVDFDDILHSAGISVCLLLHDPPRMNFRESRRLVVYTDQDVYKLRLPELDLVSGL
jgi:hypothetical protein